MKIERAIDALHEIREQAERMVKIYEGDIIPKAVAQLDQARASLHEQRSKIMEINELLERAGRIAAP